MVRIIRNLLSKVGDFEADAHRILAKREAAVSRVITIEDTYRTLTGLSLHQDQLLRESLTCLENGLHRAAHVMAWAGFMDYIQEKMVSNYLSKIDSLAKTRYDLSQREIEISRCGLRARVSIEPGLTQ